MITIPEIEADAIRYRVQARDKAQAALDDLIAQVLKRVDAPANAQVHQRPDGSLVAVAPPDPPAEEE